MALLHSAIEGILLPHEGWRYFYVTGSFSKALITAGGMTLSGTYTVLFAIPTLKSMDLGNASLTTTGIKKTTQC